MGLVFSLLVCLYFMKRLIFDAIVVQVVQAQQQSMIMTKLDWIIIWLLLLEVVVQVAGGGLMLLMKSSQNNLFNS